MKKFIMCFSEEVKNQLIAEGYSMISKNSNSGNKTMYVFKNIDKLDFAKLNFSKKDVMFTNKMLF